MTTSEEERRNILSKIPDELLQTKECKLEHSWISSTPHEAWRILAYCEPYGIKSIEITITNSVRSSYFVVIKVFISGVKYDYFNAPKNKSYPQVDIANQIANYLKILGLYVNDH